MPTNNKYRSILIVFALFISSILRGQPQVPDRPYPQKLVNDMAGLLNVDERNRLERDLVMYDDSSSNQIAIITIKSLGDYAIEDWALEIGRKWGVGRKAKNNGVLILVSLEPRKINISPGYGLEGALPDITCKRIISNEITPSFKTGQYYEGLANGIKAIRSAAKGEYVNENPRQGQGESDSGFWVFIIILIIIMIVFAIINSNRNRASYYGPNRKRHYDNGGGGWIFWGGGGGSGWGGGSGGSDSGGGFGGFGGGDFGGGGASGDW